MSRKQRRILQAIRKEKVQNKIGKKPLNGDEFERAETALSRAVKKFFAKAIKPVSLKNKA